MAVVAATALVAGATGGIVGSQLSGGSPSTSATSTFTAPRSSGAAPVSLPEGSDFTPSMTTPIAALYALPPGFFATAVADGDASPVADQLPPPDAAAEAVAPPSRGGRRSRPRTGGR